MKIDLKARKRNLELIRQTFDAPTMPKEETLKEGDVCVVVGNKTHHHYFEMETIVEVTGIDGRYITCQGTGRLLGTHGWSNRRVINQSILTSDVYKIGEL